MAAGTLLSLRDKFFFSHNVNNQLCCLGSGKVNYVFFMISLCIQEIILTARLRHKIIIITILKGLCAHGFWPHL